MNALPELKECDETAAKSLVWDKPVRPWTPRVVEPAKRRKPRRASLWAWVVAIHGAVADWLEREPPFCAVMVVLLSVLVLLWIVL